MRYTREIDGILRLKTSREIKSIPLSYYSEPKPPAEPTEDTKIRKDINETIIKMIKEGKNDIQAEIYLTNLYPKYADYILKMISHHFTKMKASKNNNFKGEER